MLNETSFHKRENGDDTLRSPATSQFDVVVYVRDLSIELQAMAKKSGLVTLAYLLSMVALQASELAEQHGESVDP